MGVGIAEISAEHAAGLDEEHFVFLNVLTICAALMEKDNFFFFELFLT